LYWVERKDPVRRGLSPAEEGLWVRYPGENTLRLREENHMLGLLEAVSAEIRAM
jgi:hypothetical protein